MMRSPGGLPMLHVTLLMVWHLQRDVWERALFIKASAPGANFRTVIQRHPRVS